MGTSNTTLTAAGQTASGSSGDLRFGDRRDEPERLFDPVHADRFGLTAAQTAQLVRSGSVSGNDVMVSGKLTLLSIVEADETEANPGLVILSAKCELNILNATGTVSGNSMTLTETGAFAATGSFSDQGVNGSYSITITSSSTADFTWATGVRPQVRTVGSDRMARIQVDAPGAPPEVAERIRAAFERALVFLY